MDLKNERVLVSGGNGFLGKFVCQLIKEKNINPIIPRKRDFNLTKVDDIQRLLKFAEPTVIIHLAAVCGGIGANQKEPGRFFYDNAMMGIQLIEESRKIGVKKFVCVGTVCAYPSNTSVPFKESSLWDGYPEETNAPYGLAKKMLLVQLQAYRQQYGFNGIYLLPVNLYGPGDNFDLESSHVIPAMIRKFVEAKENKYDCVKLWGTGVASREFLFARDAAAMILRATKTLDSSEPINLGTGKSIRIDDLANLIKNIVGYEGLILWESSRPDGQMKRQLDVSKAKSHGIHVESVSFKEGLRETIQWYLDHRQTSIER